MVLKEIRKNIVDEKGRAHNKLACIAYARKNSIVLSIKNSDLKGEVLVDFISLVKPHVNKGTADNLEKICNSIRENLKRTS